MVDGSDRRHAGAPCWRGCGQPAAPGSLSCAACDTRDRAEHACRTAQRLAGYRADRETAERLRQATLEVPCARCKTNPVPASWAAEDETEAARAALARRLRSTGVPAAEAARRSFGLAAAHLFQRDRGVCADCAAEDAADWAALCEPARVPCCWRDCPGPCVAQATDGTPPRA